MHFGVLGISRRMVELNDDVYRRAFWPTLQLFKIFRQLVLLAAKGEARSHQNE